MEIDVARRSAERKLDYHVILAGCFFVDPNVLANIKRKRLEKYGYFI